MGTQTALRITVVFTWFCSAVFHALGAAPTTNCVREAAPDFTYDANPGTHVLYLPGLATDFVSTAPGHSLLRPEPACHLGRGANRNNVTAGASRWLDCAVPSQLTNSSSPLDNTGQGDVLVELFTCLPGGEQGATHACPDQAYSDR